MEIASQLTGRLTQLLDGFMVPVRGKDVNNEDYDIPIRCKGVAAILLKKFDIQYKVLLLKRASSLLNNAWCYIGGSIEREEKAWQPALREIKEETGIAKVVGSERMG